MPDLKKAKALACLSQLCFFCMLGISVSVDAADNTSTKANAEDRALLAEAKSILQKVPTTTDLKPLLAQADALMDKVIDTVPIERPVPYIQAAVARRAVLFFGQISADQRAALSPLLKINPPFITKFLLMLKPQDDPVAVATQLIKLLSQRKDAVLTFSNLAVAISVVHDVPLKRQIVENEAKAPDSIAIFDYYVTQRKKMTFDIVQTPPQILIWMVDTTASIPEMQWALNRYASKRQVGRVYFEITYDKNHFYRGIPKKVTQVGFNLPNIRKYGGVCADQAYYAMAVSKAIGIPSCMAKGERSQVFHAWVGFLESKGKFTGWNFEHGRYAAYRHMRGTVTNPQTFENIPDSYVGLTAAWMGMTDQKRWETVAMTDALDRLVNQRMVGKNGAGQSDPSDQADSGAQQAQQAMTLFGAIHQRNPGYDRAWLLVGDLAQRGVLNTQQKSSVGGQLMRSIGKNYPDFTIAVLKKIIASVKDINEQEQLWQSAFREFGRRKELAAEILLARAHMWDQAGQTVKAGQYYLDILNQYANDGPFVIEALLRTEEQLKKAGLTARIPRLYQQTLARIFKPGKYNPQFRKLSNWYRVASLYHQRLLDAGLKSQAARVLQMIDKELKG